MQRLLGVHLAFANTALRLFLLHLLWLLHTLRGGIVLGVFPATAAVHAVLRRDAIGTTQRPSLWVEFDQQWRDALRQANLVGYPLLAVAVLALWEVRVLSQAAPTGLTGGVSVVLTLVVAAIGMMTANVWMLGAHFDGGARDQLRRSALLVCARPLVSLAAAVAVALTVMAYYLVPGLVPVFGVTVPALVSVRVLWHSGALPAPAASSVPDVTATAVEAAA